MVIVYAIVLAGSAPVLLTSGACVLHIYPSLFLPRTAICGASILSKYVGICLTNVVDTHTHTVQLVFLLYFYISRSMTCVMYFGVLRSVLYLSQIRVPT
jgi:hypothetical protein